MMKNVYAIGAYQVSAEDFTLDVLYQDDKTGNAINYIPEGELNKKILLETLNLDNLNSNNDPYPDGLFDYIPGITINSSNGRVFFPVLEPFGRDLEKIIRENGGDQSVVDQIRIQGTCTIQQRPRLSRSQKKTSSNSKAHSSRHPHPKSC